MLYLAINKEKGRTLHRSAFQKIRNKTMRAKIHKVCLYGQTTFYPHSIKNKLIFIALLKLTAMLSRGGGLG